VKKSGLISFCGWACIALVGFIVGSLAIDYGYRPGPYPIPRALSALALLGSVFFFIPWALGNIVHRFRLGTARMRAEALVEAQQRAGLVPLPAVATGGNRTTAPAAVPVCGVCHRTPATVRCIQHRVLLCQTCWHTHILTEHGAGMPSARSQQGILQPSTRPPKCG